MLYEMAVSQGSKATGHFLEIVRVEAILLEHLQWTFVRLVMWHCHAGFIPLLLEVSVSTMQSGCVILPVLGCPALYDRLVVLALHCQSYLHRRHLLLVS